MRRGRGQGKGKGSRCHTKHSARTRRLASLSPRQPATATATAATTTTTAVNGRRLAHEWHQVGRGIHMQQGEGGGQSKYPKRKAGMGGGVCHTATRLRLQAYRKVTRALQLFRNASSKCDRSTSEAPRQPRQGGRGGKGRRARQPRAMGHNAGSAHTTAGSIFHCVQRRRQQRQQRRRRRRRQ